MYAVGDKLLYGTMGIIEICEIADQTVGDVTKKYYVLKEYGSIMSSYTYVPCDNEQLTSQMRPLLTRKEAEHLISIKDKVEPLEWDDDPRRRADHYKSIVASGDREGMIAMIKSIQLMGKKRVDDGKKNYIADENSMKRVYKLLMTELSIALGIPDDQLPVLIEGV